MMKSALMCIDRFLCFIFFLALPSALFASESSFSFQLHPQASVLYQTSQQNNDYIIALSKYKKVDNRWVPEKWQREAGQLLRYTIEMPKDYTEDAMFSFYREQLPAKAELLFGCKGRGCGESNNWANDHFGIKQLYGTDSSQAYSVFRLSDANQPQAYVTIYTVRRGNRRLYAQLEVLLVNQNK